MKKKLFVILGMARSGTSVLSRSLSSLEINIGNNFIPAVKGVNSKGFWEDKDIYDLNIKILNFLKINWSSLLPINQSQIKLLKNKNFFTKAVNLINGKLKNTNNFAFKEPRVTKLLPFWKLVFKEINADVSYLIAIRNPLSVAQSLFIRDKYSNFYSSLVWQDYTTSALYYTNNEKRIIINYDDLMDNPNRTLIRISKFLNKKINPVLKKEFINEFLTLKLRNNFNTTNDLKKCLFPKNIYDLYKDLIKVKQSKINDKDIKLSFKVYRNNYLENSSFYELIDQNYNFGESKLVGKLQSHITHLTKAVHHYKKLAEDQESHITHLTKAVHHYKKLDEDQDKNK